MSENLNNKSTNIIEQYMSVHVTTGICLLGLDAQKTSCTKISTRIHDANYNFIDLNHYFS